MLFIFHSGKMIRFFFIVPPAGKITCLYFYAFPIQHENVINTSIQQIPVMGYENKSFFRGKIIFDDFSGSLIQMIGRLINQEKIIFS